MATQSEIDLSDLTREPREKLGGLEIMGVAEQDPFINMLVYGFPGAGKTVLAGSADVVAEMSPTLFIDVEGGTFSLRKFYPDVQVVRVKTWRDMQAVYDSLYRGTEYKTVVLDSLTEIQRLSMYQIMKETVAKDEERDPEVPAVREWGKNGEQTRRMVRAFRDLPMNTIFTCLARVDKDQKTGFNLHKPSLTGKLADEITGYFDLCVFLYTSVTQKKDQEPEVLRRMLTGATNTHVAKDRSSSLPLVIEDPSMQIIHNHIFSGGR